MIDLNQALISYTAGSVHLDASLRSRSPECPHARRTRDPLGSACTESLEIQMESILKFRGQKVFLLTKLCV